MVLATVIVLGDIGRSPRMQYHANSLLMQGYDVEIIGYGGSKPIKEICDNKKVTIKTLEDCPPFHEYLPRLSAYILKTLWLILSLFLCLIFKRRSHFLLVQTPPAIPTLAVCWIYCVLHRTTYIIDWHNYAFKNMALSLGDNHKLVKISHWFEGHFGRKAEFNLCVTKAMKDDLKERWNIVATVLYDRPFDSFSAVKTEDKHSFFRKICKDYPVFADKNDSENSTKFTTCLPDGSIILKQERPALLISSTSWTEDEDFSVLFTALQEYDKSEIESLPNLICVITGKGPLKDYYKGLINKYNWKRVEIITPWLESEDYPVMLGCADLGVSLHMSTSGLDLPMKVVDMFGCGLPVAAFNFPALKELVRQGENGTVFTNSTELSEQLQDWFKNFPNDQGKLKKFRDNIKKNFQIRWHENWMLNAFPLFEYNVTSFNKKS